MKCIYCGAELKTENDSFICDYCGSSFLKEELMPTTIQNNEFKIVGGVLLSYFGNKTEVTIPSGTMMIGQAAFKNNLAVRKVIFSKSTTSIGKNAFEGCINLTDLENYSNVMEYDDECFMQSGLKQVRIGKNVKHLGIKCFANMPNLESVIYTPGKTLKLKNTFSHCPNLVEVKADKNYFFPSIHTSQMVLNNPNNERPTLGDVFLGTPYIKIAKDKLLDFYKQGKCPECGGKISKGLFHSKCKNCGIDYKN